MPVVLIVEDNPINRDVLGRRLERRGYSVRFAEDGPTRHRGSGKAKTRYHPDGHRPGRAYGWLGGDTAHQGRPGDGRHSDHRPHCASAFESDRKKSLAAGCCDFDTKPVDLLRLLGKIENSLRRFRLISCARRSISAS